MADDPYAILGVEPGVSEEELRAVRRRLAKELHPDHSGGTTDAMRRLNLAFDAALADLTRTHLGHENGGTVDQSGDQAVAPVPRPGGRLAYDVASFTVEALPVEAFEALLIVAAWLGEVLVDEPPYQLDVALGEPFGCWCRLDLVPDAGACTVALTLAAMDDRPVPELDHVRDAWVAQLNELGRPD